MLKRRTIAGTSIVKLSFVIPGDDPRLPAAVVGDFNDWDESADRFQRRGNGTASAVVSLEAGRRYRFRYRSADGTWFNDDAADAYVANEHGSTDCVVVA